MATVEFFRARLDPMIYMRYPLAVLVTRIEASQGPVLAHKDCQGRTAQDVDLFGQTLEVLGAGVSNPGHLRLPVRLMVTLLYLKHFCNESDESVVERWAQEVYFQFFSGMAYFDSRPPCDPRRSGAFAWCWARRAWSNCSR